VPRAMNLRRCIGCVSRLEGPGPAPPLQPAYQLLCAQEAEIGTFGETTARSASIAPDACLESKHRAAGVLG
jgi:hypothetical protein